MKEILNEIRKEIEIHSDEACFIPDDMMVIPSSWILKKLDEAEAKWETDCCEWKFFKPSNLLYENHGDFRTGDELEKWNVCPYCGKKIARCDYEEAKKRIHKMSVLCNWNI